LDVGEEILVTHRKEILNLLVHPPCPECGAYEGVVFKPDSDMDFAFGDCENEYCLNTYAWERVDDATIRGILRGGK